MTTSKRLRQLADRTGLDGFADELRAMADEMDGAAQPAPVQPVQPVYQIAKKDGPASQAWIDVDAETFEDTGFYPEDFNRRKLYTTPPAAPDLRSQAARIAELEAEVNEQARLNGMGAERELALRAEVERLQRAIKAAKKGEA